MLPPCIALIELYHGQAEACFVARITRVECIVICLVIIHALVQACILQVAISSEIYHAYVV